MYRKESNACGTHVPQWSSHLVHRRPASLTPLLMMISDRIVFGKAGASGPCFPLVKSWRNPTPLPPPCLCVSSTWHAWHAPAARRLASCTSSPLFQTETMSSRLDRNLGRSASDERGKVKREGKSSRDPAQSIAGRGGDGTRHLAISSTVATT